LAAASQGPTELIEPDVNGILTPIDEPVAMAEAIRKAVRDPDGLARMAAAGRQAFEARFTEAAVVAQYRAFFDQVIAQKAVETAS
jgi:glycosyltransferase involved in cell wall biosynthesis